MKSTYDTPSGLIFSLNAIQHFEVIRNTDGSRAGARVIFDSTRWDNASGGWANNAWVPDSELENLLVVWRRYRESIDNPVNHVEAPAKPTAHDLHAVQTKPRPADLPRGAGIILTDPAGTGFWTCKRKHIGKDYDGYDEVPGGMAEDDENDVDAALRELLEETGISASELQDMHLIHRGQYTSPSGKEYISTQYMAIATTIPALKEANKQHPWRFVTWDKCHMMRWMPGTHDALAFAINQTRNPKAASYCEACDDYHAKPQSREQWREIECKLPFVQP